MHTQGMAESLDDDHPNAQQNLVLKNGVDEPARQSSGCSRQTFRSELVVSSFSRTADLSVILVHFVLEGEKLYPLIKSDSITGNKIFYCCLAQDE